MTIPKTSIARSIGPVVVLVVAIAACTTAATTAPSDAGEVTAGGGLDVAAARDYCTDQGGEVVTRRATWNTNADPTQWLALANSMDLCEFEMGEGDETTRISVDLGTLYAEEPTLAAVAYLSKVPPPQTPQAGVNPGGYDCTAGLGGASSFGNTAAGGGWVNADEPVFTVMNLCVFADLSAIDEFGIFYYANGIVRGADLATKFRYRPGDTLPPIFTTP